MLLFTSYNLDYPHSQNATQVINDEYQDHLGTECHLCGVTKENLYSLLRELQDDINQRLATNIGNDDEFFDYFPDKIHIFFQLLYHYITTTYPNGKLNRQLYQHCLNGYQTAMLAYDIREGNDLYTNDELCASNNCFFPDYEETETYIKSLQQ